MNLTPGTRIGPYEVVSMLGAGGMGEVYRARDPRLGRDVAIKILPETLAHDPERLARFEREARMLASLNHPNVGQIHDFEQSDGMTALVMELVEGPTLADRIAQRPLPLDEALPIAKQIAEALEAAHEHGIIHRDLKPANIKVRNDGTAKVLDFGLAKVLEPISGMDADATSSPTITSPAMTRMGVILGTAAYMSPEQAKGRSADQRSDIWAFGCVLYEMLAGTRAFGGEDVSDTLASVLRGEPEWTALPSTVSPAIVALIQGCLTKDPRQRIGAISTARFIFDHGTDVAASVPARSSLTLRRTAPILIAAAAAAVIAAYTTWMLKPVPAPLLPLARFPIPLPADRFTNSGRQLVAISPNGSRLVYAANGRLYLRAMDQLEPTPIRGTEGHDLAAARSPFFSAEGQWIGFWQDGQLKKVSTSGSAPVPLCRAITPFGASWTTDNTILYGQGEAGIWRVSGDGGTPENVVKVEKGEIAHGPQLLPGGRAVLFTLAREGTDWDAAQIVVHSLDTGTRRPLTVEGADARYVPTGHLVYARQNTLLAVPFDVATLAVTGGPVSLMDDVARAPQNPVALTGAAHFATSSEGTLVYVPADALDIAPPRRSLMWVDRQGREDPIQVPPRAYRYPRLSSDGTRVALDIRDQDNDIWILDLARPILTPLTTGPATETHAIWNGQAVIFSRGLSPFPVRPSRNLFRQAPDGGGTAEQLTDGVVTQFPFAVTPGGTELIFWEVKDPVNMTGDLMLLPLLPKGQPQLLLQTKFRETNWEISPDGNWLAYQSNKSGREEIWVRTFPDVRKGEQLVSTSGGRMPLWAPNGRELFYESMGTLMRVPLMMTGSTIKPGTPVKLLGGQYFYGAPGQDVNRTYDVSPDGSRFLMIKAIDDVDESQASARLILVLNWFEELKRRVPTK